MAEQRARAKADAQARKTGHTDLSAYRAVLEGGGPVEFTGYTEVARESRVRALLVRRGRPARGRRRGPDGRAGARRHPVLRRGRWPAARPRHDHGRRAASWRCSTCSPPVPGLIVHRARVVRGEVRAGEAGFAEIDVTRRRAISRAHTATHLVHQTMRNFLGESATQAGSLNAPGRLRFDFNTPGAVPPSRADRRRAADQRGAAARPGGARVHHLAGRGAPDGRDGAVRREVRRRGPGRRGRRLRPGAVRRHPRRPLQPARPGEDPAGVVDRLGGAPGRGAGGPGRLPSPGAGAPAGVPARRAVPGAAATRSPTGWSRPSPRCGTPRRSWRSSARSWFSAARRRSRRRRWTCAASPTSAPRRRRARPPTTCAPSPRRSAGKIPAGRPAVVAVAARAGGKASLVVAVNAAARERGVSASDLVKGGAVRAGGGNAELAQGGGVPADRGADPARRGRGAAVTAAAGLVLEWTADAPVRWRGPGGGCERSAPGSGSGSMSARSASGVAVCDPDGILATPLVTLARDRTAAPDAVPSDMAELARLVAEHEVVEVVVGLPVRSPGRKGRRRLLARQIRRPAGEVVAPVPVVWQTRGCLPLWQPVGCPSGASGASVNARWSTRPPRWRSCRAGSTRSGGGRRRSTIWIWRSRSRA